MEDRKRIGFYYVWDKSWMGGVMYARNLLKALNSLEDKDKPFIDVYCWKKEAFEDLKSHTGYPYLEMVITHDNSIIQKVHRTLVAVFFGARAKARLSRFKVNPADVILFPFGFGKEVEKYVFWRPDFQEKYLPEFFTSADIKNRDRNIRLVAERGIPIVFSSHDSEKDFQKFYPEYTNKTFVMHFAVDHPDFSNIKIDEVKAKYGIKREYLLCANQFWQHKNHLFLFRAYKKAMKRGLRLQLVCTGNLQDNRKPDYINEIKSFVTDNNLSGDIILPGLINSDELHALMKYSYAVVQPSLFEGWNTTVEDCKALSKFIFLSNLLVHKEQISENVCFFDPHNEEDLIEKLLTVKPTEHPIDYSRELKAFGENFLEVIRYVEKRKNL